MTRTYEYECGVLHITELGMALSPVARMLQIISLDSPMKGDDRIVSIETSDGSANTDIIIKTRGKASHRINFKAISDIAPMHKQWTPIVTLKTDDRITSAACHGPRWSAQK